MIKKRVQEDKGIKMSKSFITKLLITLFISSFGLIFSAGAWAQAWPTKSIKFVVPYPPGGGTDVIARIVQEPLSQALGQQIIIDNRGGAGARLVLTRLLSHQRMATPYYLLYPRTRLTRLFTPSLPLIPRKISCLYLWWLPCRKS